MQQASLSPEDYVATTLQPTLTRGLVALCRARGNLEGARALFREAVDGAREVLGVEHPHTKAYVQWLQAVGG